MNYLLINYVVLHFQEFLIIHILLWTLIKKQTLTFSVIYK